MHKKFKCDQYFGGIKSSIYKNRETILFNGKLYKKGMKVQSDYFDGAKEITLLCIEKKTESPPSQAIINEDNCYAYLDDDISNPYHLSVLDRIDDSVLDEENIDEESYKKCKGNVSEK